MRVRIVATIKKEEQFISVANAVPITALKQDLCQHLVVGLKGFALTAKLQ